jgi:telomerase reverse transcriptase
MQLDDHPHFLQHASQLAGTLRHMIFVDQVRTDGGIISGVTHIFRHRWYTHTLKSKIYYNSSKNISRRISLKWAFSIQPDYASELYAVKMGPDYYRQMVGIPQGSVLSSLLCSFFYGDLEKRFGMFTEDAHSVRDNSFCLVIPLTLAENTGHDESYR